MSSRINIKIKNVEVKTSIKSGFEDVFQIITTDRNVFYKFLTDSLPIKPSSSIYNGKLIDMPIPDGLTTLSGDKIKSPDGSNTIPLLISIEPNKATSKVEKHFCEDIQPDRRGTACAGLLQQPIEESLIGDSNSNFITYFKSNKKIPDINGNFFLNAYVQLFNLTYIGGYIYLLPTIAPNNSVIYIVSSFEKPIQDLIKDCPTGKSEDYFIGLNGFLVYIDEWDCTVFFNDFIFDTVDVNQKKISIHSKAVVHRKKPQSKHTKPAQ
jgi:hypothetical protein